MIITMVITKDKNDKIKTKDPIIRISLLFTAQNDRLWNNRDVIY